MKRQVSIIVPVYNVEKYLEQCVDSLINQTYRGIEIVLVNDGSKDSSATICDAYAQKDSRVKVIHKPNGGSSSARKAGIEVASGDFMMFVDGDDWIDKETISVCLKCLDKNPNLDCVLFSYVKEYPTKSIPVHVFNKSQYYEGNVAKDKIYRRLFGLLNNELEHPERMDNIVSCCMKLYKAEDARKGKYFDTKIIGSSEDALFNMYALADVNNAVYIDKPFYHYRKLDVSLTNSFRPDLIKQWNNLFNIILSIIDEKKLGNEYLQALKNRVALSIYGIGTNELINKDINVFKRIQNIQCYISTPNYRKAIVSTDMKYMPITWKAFMVCCKLKCSVAIYLMLATMSYLKKRV